MKSVRFAILIIIISAYCAALSLALSPRPSLLRCVHVSSTVRSFLSLLVVVFVLTYFVFFFFSFLFRRIITHRPNRNVIWLADLRASSCLSFFSLSLSFSTFEDSICDLQICSTHLMMRLCQSTNHDDDGCCCCCCYDVDDSSGLSHARS